MTYATAAMETASVTLKAHMRRDMPARRGASQGPTAQAGLVQQRQQPDAGQVQQVHDKLPAEQQQQVHGNLPAEQPQRLPHVSPAATQQPHALDPPAEEASAAVKRADDTANL